MVHWIGRPNSQSISRHIQMSSCARYGLRAGLTSSLYASCSETATGLRCQFTDRVLNTAQLQEQHTGARTLGAASSPSFLENTKTRCSLLDKRIPSTHCIVLDHSSVLSLTALSVVSFIVRQQARCSEPLTVINYREHVACKSAG